MGRYPRNNAFRLSADGRRLVRGLSYQQSSTALPICVIFRLLFAVCKPIGSGTLQIDYSLFPRFRLLPGSYILALALSSANVTRLPRDPVNARVRGRRAGSRFLRRNRTAHGWHSHGRCGLRWRWPSREILAVVPERERLHGRGRFIRSRGRRKLGFAHECRGRSAVLVDRREILKILSDGEITGGEIQWSDAILLLPRDDSGSAARREPREIGHAFRRDGLVVREVQPVHGCHAVAERV